MSQDFIFELLCEELPPKALQSLRDALASNVKQGLEKATLSFDRIEAYASPRRLAFCVYALADKQADQVIDRKGPAVNAAYDTNGNPTPAALGFAKSCGIELDQASTVKTDKGEWLFYQVQQAGQATAELLPSIIEHALKNLPIPKLMSWGEGEHHFTRPVKNVLAVLGNSVVPMNLFGLDSQHSTVGHRFHHPEAIDIHHASDYLEKLRKAYVLVDFNERKEQIASHITGLAESHNATIVANDALLDEVTALVEWPNALLGEFDKKFLAVPDEVLILSMATHQRYFALRDPSGALLNQFILVSNIQAEDPRQIIRGNEKVLRARFADALFFFEKDKRVGLLDRRDLLISVTFQQQLGTLFEKTQRIETIANRLAELIGADKNDVSRASQLCKCDLLTDMVGEFPELQGTMGRYYATDDNEKPAVAEALEDYYKPRFSGDALSDNPVALCVAMADRIDTIVGIIGINKLPTGDKDPFALRRQVLGILRIILEKSLSIDVSTLIEHAISCYGDKLSNPHVASQTFGFIEERLKHYLLQQNFRADQCQAVLSLGLPQPLEVLQRLTALRDFESHDAFESLVAANKRVANVLKKQSGNGRVKPNELKEAAEIALNQQAEKLRDTVMTATREQRFDDALIALATLKPTLDCFFDEVMVMCDDEALRENRLALLTGVRHLFLHIADFSELQ